MMAARARKHGVYITGGVIEEATDGKLFNSMPIFGPDGNLHAVYRKVR
jgi:predicted amidohydrolase